MDVYIWVEGLQLPLVRCQMGVAEVADIDRFGAIVGKLVRAGTADPIGRVCA